VITCSNGFPESTKPSNLVELLRWRASCQPEQRAYTFLPDGETEEVSLTYGELDRQARAIGAMLQDLGATGERALLFFPPGLEYIAAFFGCLYAGVVAVPTYPPRSKRTLPQIQAILADAQAKVALTTTQVLSNVKHHFTHAQDLEAMCWLTTDNIAGDLAAELRDAAVTENTLAYLQYTSGATATPKGVMVSHGNVLHNLAYIDHGFEHTSDSVSVTWLPHFHDMGLVYGLIQPLYKGFPCFLMPPMSFIQRPILWLQAISRNKATHSGGPNFAYGLCTRRITPEQRATLDLSSWCVAFNGAEPVRKETLECFDEAFAPCGFRWSAFYPAYGLAEATLKVSGGLKTDRPVFYTTHATNLTQNQVVESSEDLQNVRTLVGCGRAMGDTKSVIDQRLVLTESVIDALSYHGLFGNENTRYASTSGAWSLTTKEMIRVATQALPITSGTIILAYDNDSEGERYRKATREILFDSGKQLIDHRPKKKDFNEDLQGSIQ
jgi:acyl-CoA synthetase (AMP-forming)/AMP-acid ligase II